MNIKKSDPKESERYLIQKLSDFNILYSPSMNDYTFEEVSFLVADENKIIGGIYGYIEYYGWLYVSLLYVEEEYRFLEIGSKLLNRMEDYAYHKNCKGVYLNTWEFQAKEFYLKKGYVLFGNFTPCLDGYSLYYLKKEF